MLERADIEILINIYFWNLHLWTFLGMEGRGLRETSMGRFWLQNRFLSLPLYFKLIALDSYPHPALNHSIVQKKMFKASFSSGTVSATDNGLHHSSLGRSFAFVYYFLFRHLVKVLRTGALFDSGRTKVAKEEQCIWLFNQSNRSIDLNQLISA